MQTLKNQSSTSLSILIVDDSSSERTLLSARLRGFGHRTTEAADGLSALDYLADDEQQFDLIFLDVRMPGLDGFETAQSIRKLEEKRTEEWRPIIFLSGRTEPSDIAQGIEAGGDDYLAKPIDTTVLKAKITAMQRIANMRRRLVVQAHTDELTQLPNRRRFLAILDTEIARARRYNTALSIVYLDLDHFKQINDTYGHDAGDIVLCTVAKALSGKLRTEDCIGRLGGEEFCICLPGANAENSIEPCERYRSLIENLVIDSGSQSLKVTASFGLTSFNHLSDSRSSLLARADEALYQAKQGGRNRVSVIPCSNTA